MTRLLILGAVAALAACTPVGPDYHVPDTAEINDPTALGPFVSARPSAIAQAPLPDSWWRLYDDPRLNALQQQALERNTDLRVAIASLARAQAVQREIDGAQDIRAGADFGAERAQLSGESFLVPAQLPSQYLGDGGIHVSYQLDLFGRLRRAAEAAKADTEASAAGLELVRVTVAAEIARAYVEACSAGHELATAQRSVDLQERAQGITAKLAAAGRDSPLDVTRVAGQLEQARAVLPGLRSRQKAALFRLAILTGRPPGDYPKEIEACVEPPRLHQPIPVGDGIALLKRRPDVRQAERGLAAATARIGVATAALYPDIILGATAGATGRLVDLGEPQAQYWSLGSLISWSLPTDGEHARVSGADAAAQAALARFDGIVLTALRETETSLSAYAQDLDRNTALRAARDQAALLATQNETLYKAGRSPYLSGLAAQQSLAAADSAVAASDGQVAADQVALFLALGGGWPQTRN